MTDPETLARQHGAPWAAQQTLDEIAKADAMREPQTWRALMLAAIITARLAWIFRRREGE